MVVRRRHGAELEAAVLDAAWDALIEVGYAHLTMGGVAERAQTSEPVLYRRWPNKDALVLAAMEHRRKAHPIALPGDPWWPSDPPPQIPPPGSPPVMIPGTQPVHPIVAPPAIVVDYPGVGKVLVPQPVPPSGSTTAPKK